MKATIEFNLPEEQDEHAYALAGVDALIVIDELLNEIRTKLKYGGGEFKEWDVDVYNDDGSVSKKRVEGCDYTLEKVRDVLIEFKSNRNLPELV